MKTLKSTLIAFFLLAGTAFLQAQTAEEIINNYFENTGGQDAWTKIENMKITGVAAFGPQEYPFTQFAMKDGRMAVEIELQGQKFIPQAFDGETLWSTNFQTMSPEASDSEASMNFKKEAQDIIDAFLNYKDKGYSIEKLEDATVEGTETFKLKLTKQPNTIDGVEEENVTFYYFDKENFVPVMSESTISSGPQKGMMTQTLYSDYQEAGDIYYAYSITQKFNGQVGQSIRVDNIEINTDIDEAIFSMPK